MKRREFLKSSVAVAGASALASTLNLSAAEDAVKPEREFYELRLYHLRRGPKLKVFDDFYRNAALPAFERLGIGPVGIFSVMTGPDSPTMYVLMPHKSIDSFGTLGERLHADAEYLKAGAEFINAPATDPAFIRIESSLMKAFTGMPKLAAPGKKTRLFELRTYESHSKKANAKKIEMFNSGEIDIFRRAGFDPVFFGENLIGSRLPSLTYMLSFEDIPAHDKSWGAFGADPEWKKLSSTPGYTDSEIICNISNLFLRPTAYSQI
jgi:hypothetical protein